MDKNPKIEKIFEFIHSDGKSIEALQNLFNNVANTSELSEEQIENICSEIETKVREIDGRKANKIFGTKNRVTKQKLQTFHEELRGKYDLSTNRHNNGVKCGGHVIRGEAYLYDYLSYKNSENLVCHISFFQKSHDSKLTLRVWSCDVSAQTDASNHTVFPATEFEQAKRMYENTLQIALL